MSIEIDFSYVIDGLYHSVNYYRSLSPMDPTAMPTPIATGITGTTYTDTSAEKGQTYYVRFGSVRNSTEKISDEIKLRAIYDPYEANVVAHLLLENSTEDLKGNTWGFLNTNHSFDSDGIILSGGNGNGIICTNSSLMDFGTGAYTVECFLRIDSSQTSDAIIATGSTAWQSGNAIINLEDRQARHVIYGPAPIKGGAQFPLSTMQHIAFTRDNSGIFRAFFNGVLQLQVSYGYPVNFSNGGGCILFGSRFGDTTPVGRAKNIRITKGVARYTANFTPPTIY